MISKFINKNNNPHKKIAFTLAEVLITLGIIGVVAAMTIPALNQKMKNMVVETRLKKFYAEMQQVVRLSEVDNGDVASWRANTIDEAWNNFFKPYIKFSNATLITSSPEPYILTSYLVELNNGSFALFNIYRFNLSRFMGHVVFFPSKKCYNTFVKSWKKAYASCAFEFAFYPNKFSENDNTVWNHVGKGIEPYTVRWDGIKEHLMTNDHDGCNKEVLNKNNGDRPTFCTAAIQHNNWKIPKDYPFKVWY